MLKECPTAGMKPPDLGLHGQLKDFWLRIRFWAGGNRSGWAISGIVV
jgi:hypothetical protein